MSPKWEKFFENSRYRSLRKVNLLPNIHSMAMVTDEGWFIDKHVVSKICTEFNDVFFETVKFS